jgi:hypothetical protein
MHRPPKKGSCQFEYYCIFRENSFELNKNMLILSICCIWEQFSAALIAIDLSTRGVSKQGINSANPLRITILKQAKRACEAVSTVLISLAIAMS